MHHRRSVLTICLFGFLFPLLSRAQPAANLENQPPLYAPIHRLTFDEYEGTLRHWQKTHPQWASLESRGLSGRNMPVYLLKITDRSVPDADKQICLVTALHSGPERTGTTGALAFAEWLLSDAPEAAETRRRQVVLVMPVINPLALFFTDRFRNEHGVDPYTAGGRVGKVLDPKTLALAKPEQAPELAAVLAVIDQYQPEVHVDLHGTGLQEYAAHQLGRRQMYRGQIMTEVTGSAYSNFALRPWDWRVTEAMLAAGREAGFPSDRFEADAQRTFWGPELAPLGKKLWHGAPLFYSAHYGYAKYHTMMAALEVAWEQSAVARLKGLMRIGNSPWNDERPAGYPVNRLKHFVGHFVTASGSTAALRRRSRVELWSKQSAFSLGFLYPQTDGRETLVCATTAAAKKVVAADDVGSLQAGLRSLLGAEAGETLARFIEAGPEIKLVMDTPPAALAVADPAEDAVIEHGIGFRVRLSCQDSQPIAVELNGVPLKQQSGDGFETWLADGFRQVQIDVPAAKARGTGLFFITCRYAPPPRPPAWMPPAEVQRQFATAKADATPPTFADVAYGPHFRQTLDFWQAPGSRPTPLVFYIHGGGWAAGDKNDIHRHLDVAAFLKDGISVASVNYRLLQDANAGGIVPPLQWPMADVARALQFARSNAQGWRIDRRQVAATGVSAGGCAALWLGLHDDMADAASADAVARESTRLVAVAAKAPVTSLDPQQLRDWIPNSIFGAHAFGYAQLSRADSFKPFLAERARWLPEIRRYSPIEHVTSDDPPVFVEFPNQDRPPVRGEAQTDPTHSAVSGLMLQQAMAAAGVECELRYKNDGKQGDADVQAFLTRVLRRR